MSKFTLNITGCINTALTGIEQPTPNGTTLHIKINGSYVALWLVYSTSLGKFVVVYSDPGGTQLDCDVTSCLPPHPSSSTTYTFNEDEFSWNSTIKWHCGAPN